MSEVHPTNALTTLGVVDPPWWQFWHHFHHHHATSRAVSMWAAAATDVLIIIYYGPMADFSPRTVDGAMVFGLTIFSFAILYGVIQQWTLTKQTGTGEETAASLDKLFALSLAVLTIIYLIGHFIHAFAIGLWLPTLTASHYVTAVWIIVYSVFDFMTTDVTNMRLRSLQLQGRPAGT